MDVSKGILINKSLLEIELVSQEEIKIVDFEDNEAQENMNIRTIRIKEYDVK